MFVHEELLAVIFRLFNFGILVFLCAHVFRRYMLPAIHEQMKEQADEQQRIKARHEELSVQEKAVARFAVEQKELCQHLQERVVQWRDVQHANFQERDEVKGARIVELQNKVAMQEHYLMRNSKKKVVVPSAVKEASYYLYQEFQTGERADEKGRAFMSQFMQIIEKEAL